MRILVALNGDLLSFSDREQVFMDSRKKVPGIIDSLGELILHHEVMITYSDVPGSHPFCVLTKTDISGASNLTWISALLTWKES